MNRFSKENFDRMREEQKANMNAKHFEEQYMTQPNKAKNYDELPGGMNEAVIETAGFGGGNYEDEEDDYDPTGDPLRYRLNPCTISRFKVLEPIGDAVAKLAVECPCCNGFRMIGAAILGLVIGGLLL